MASGLFFGNTSESLGSHCNFASSLLPSCIGWRWSMRRINYSQNDDDNDLLAPWDSMRAPLHPYTYNTCMHAQKGAESPSIVTGKIHPLVSPLPLSISLPRLVCAAANNDDGRRRRRRTCQAIIPPPSKQRSRGPSTRPRKAEKGRGRNGASPRSGGRTFQPIRERGREGDPLA